MEAKVVSNISRSIRMTKDRYNKVHKLLSKKREHTEINQSMMCGINQIMNYLVSTAHSLDMIIGRSIKKCSDEMLKLLTKFEMVHLVISSYVAECELPMKFLRGKPLFCDLHGKSVLET